jgi:DNA-binding winged helix-turn-helix (wHTH) protein
MIYRFEGVSFDTASGELRCGQQLVQLTVQSHQLLQLLIDHRNRVVSKEELCDRVWRSKFASDEAIHTAVATLRRALARVSTPKQLIRTVHRSGYRFASDVEIDPNPAFANADGEWVGREDEIKALCEVLQAADDAKPRVSVLTGDAGIGKTRTAFRVAGIAERSGFLALTGAGFEGMATSPLTPWISMLRAARSAVGGRSWGDLVDDLTLDYLDPLLNESGPAPFVPFSGTNADAVGLFDQTTRLLRRLSESRPLLLLFDDIHAYDALSIRLLEHVSRFVRPARIGILATVRHEAASPNYVLAQRVARDVRRESSGRVIDLGPLDSADVEQLFVAVKDRKPSAREQRALVERSEGNPLFALELLQLGISETGEAAQLGVERVPRTLTEIIQTRLSTLPEGTLEVLGAAAVLGRRFDPVFLAEIMHEKHGRIEETLALAEGARVLELRQARLDECSFTHVLLRDVLYSMLSLERRARLHLIAASALASDRSHPSVGNTVDIAYHRSSAAPYGDLTLAADSCIEAAFALRDRRLAFAESANQLRTAERIQGMAEAGLDRKRLETRLLLAECEQLAGDSASSARIYLELIESARSAGDTELLGRATIGLFVPYYQGSHSDQWDSEQRSWLGLAREAIEELVGPEHEPLVARLKSRLALQLVRKHRIPEAAELSGQCRAAARSLRDPGLLAEVFADSHLEMVARGKHEELLDLTRRGSAAAQASGSRALVHRFQLHLLDHGLATGNVDSIRSQVDRVIDRSECLGAYEARRASIMWALFEGRLIFARESLDDLLTALRISNGGAEPSVPLLIQQMRLRQLADGAEARVAAYEPYAARDPANLLVRAHLAHALADVNRLSESREIIDELCERSADVLARRDWAILLVSLSAAATRAGAGEGIRRFREALLPYRHGFVLWPGATLCCAPAALVCGRLAAALGLRTEMNDDFALSMDLSARAGARPFVVETRRAWGDALLCGDGVEDRAQGADLLTSAHREARQIGMLADRPDDGVGR